MGFDARAARIFDSSCLALSSCLAVILDSSWLIHSFCICPRFHPTYNTCFSPYTASLTMFRVLMPRDCSKGDGLKLLCSNTLHPITRQ